ncbi:MAG: CopG family transcriptional regulator [Dehalococcoidia bacterium]
MAKVKRPRKARTWRTAAGQVLTEADIEALAAEAEAGYDLSKGTVVYVGRGGRPSLGAGVSPRIGFRTSRALYAAAVARAAQEGRTVSELARAAIAQYVGTEQNK